MDSFDLALYSQLLSLDSKDSSQRHWPLHCYPHLHEVNLVSIALNEVRALARSLPVAFLREDQGVRAVALVGLRGAANLLSRLDPPGALPLILRAFPVALGEQDEQGHIGILINARPPDMDLPGTAAFASDGAMTPTTVEKTDALWLFAATRNRTAAIVRDLHDKNAFEPWPLRLVFTDRAVDVGDLLRVRYEYLQSEAYRDLIATHGFEVASALHYHLMSLTRIDRLIEAKANSAGVALR